MSAGIIQKIVFFFIKNRFKRFLLARNILPLSVCIFLRRGKINCLTHRFARFKFSTVHSAHEEFPFSALTLALLPTVLNYDVRIKTRDTKMAIKWNLIRDIAARTPALSLRRCSREIAARNYTRAKYRLLFRDKANVFSWVSSREHYFANAASFPSAKYHLFRFARAFAKICVFHVEGNEMKRSGEKGRECRFTTKSSDFSAGKLR